MLFRSETLARICSRPCSLQACIVLASVAESRLSELPVTSHFQQVRVGATPGGVSFAVSCSKSSAPNPPRPDPAFQPPTSAAQGRASASPRAQAHAPHTEPKCLAHAPSCGSSSPAHHRSSLPPPRSHRSWSRSPPPPKKPCPPTLSSKQLNHRNSRTQGTTHRLGSLWLFVVIGHCWSHFGHSGTPPIAAARWAISPEPVAGTYL